MNSIALALWLNSNTQCRIAGAFGWAATLDIMLLFFPVPRSTFLHWLLGSSFPALIKYHRLAALPCILLLILLTFFWMLSSKFTGVPFLTAAL